MVIKLFFSRGRRSAFAIAKSSSVVELSYPEYCLIWSTFIRRWLASEVVVYLCSPRSTCTIFVEMLTHLRPCLHIPGSHLVSPTQCSGRRWGPTCCWPGRLRTRPCPHPDDNYNIHIYSYHVLLCYPVLTGNNLTMSTSPACQGYSLTSVVWPPTILAAQRAGPGRNCSHQRQLQQRRCCSMVTKWNNINKCHVKAENLPALKKVCLLPSQFLSPETALLSDLKSSWVVMVTHSLALGSSLYQVQYLQSLLCLQRSLQAYQLLISFVTVALW